MLILTTLHASHVRELRSGMLDNTSSYDRFLTELRVSTDPVTLWALPMITMVFCSLYMAIPDYSNNVFRFFVVSITMVTVVFTMNIWQQFDDKQAKERAGKLVSTGNFELSISADMFTSVFDYMCLEPIVVIGIVVVVLFSACVRLPEGPVFKHTPVSQGNWTGKATRWVAFTICCWYWQLIHWQNVQDNTQKTTFETIGSALVSAAEETSDVFWSHQDTMPILQPFWDVSAIVYNCTGWVVNLIPAMNIAAMDKEYEPTMTGMTGKMTMFMFPFVFLCVLVGVFLPGRATVTQKLLAGPFI
jgi:hypothetical protein